MGCRSGDSIFFAGMVFCGTVEIPADAVARVLFGDVDDAVVLTIVRDVRIPMALTALVAGMALSVSGLLLQTTFNNPLAGPSILGISTGASLGVAVVMLGFGGWLGAGLGCYAGILAGGVCRCGCGDVSVAFVLDGCARQLDASYNRYTYRLSGLVGHIVAEFFLHPAGCAFLCYMGYGEFRGAYVGAARGYGCIGGRVSCGGEPVCQAA